MIKKVIAILMLCLIPSISYATETIKKDTTSKLLEVFISDSSSTIGGGLTGLVYTDCDQAGDNFKIYYYRSGAASAVQLLCVDMTVGTWVSGGFKAIDGTNMPGWYQVGSPNAMIATGASSASLHLKGATNMVPLPIAIQLVSYDPDVAWSTLTAADVNAEVDTALNTAIPVTPTADSINERVKAIDDKLPTNYIMGSAVLTAKDDDIDAILTDTGTDGVVVASGSKTGYSIASGGFPVGGFASGAITADAIATDAIGASEIAAGAIGASEVAEYAGLVISDAGNTALTFRVNLTQTADNYWKDSFLTITSGALVGQTKAVTAFTGWNGTYSVITVKGGFTGIPAGSVTFMMVNK